MNPDLSFWDHVSLGLASICVLAYIIFRIRLARAGRLSAANQIEREKREYSVRLDEIRMISSKEKTSVEQAERD